MRNDLIISKAIKINVNITKVWDVMTNPDLIKEYLFGTQTQTDWKVGSDIYFRGEFEGEHYADHGKILEYVPNQKIVYSYWSCFSGLEDIPENYSTIKYEVKKISEEQTELTWTQQGYADETRYTHSQEGMEQFLEQIKGVAER